MDLLLASQTINTSLMYFSCPVFIISPTSFPGYRPIFSYYYSTLEKNHSIGFCSLLYCMSSAYIPVQCTVLYTYFFKTDTTWTILCGLRTPLVESTVVVYSTVL